MHKSYVELLEWNVVQSGFSNEDNRIYESLMSLGNGYMGIRGNFEESFSGNTLQGTYAAGIYYPDKTRVGWWKNGYPEYFAKVLNAPNFMGIRVFIEDHEVDLNNCLIKEFTRDLNMKEGTLSRSCTFVDKNNRETKLESIKFLSKVTKEAAALSYSLTPLNYSCKISLIPFIDGDVKNEDANYDEKFWNIISKGHTSDVMYLTSETKKTKFNISIASTFEVCIDGKPVCTNTEFIDEEKLVGFKACIDVPMNSKLTLNKYISLTSDRYMDKSIIEKTAIDILNQIKEKGFNQLLDEHRNAWYSSWEKNDIEIAGDVSAQQAIRFNIFHLNQTYTGQDERLNIGPKGFTGEKYGGSTYWDTEAYCLPFYLGTAEDKIAKNLLLYRYNQLEKAKENAKKLGLKGALYPMVTMNGEECHNEWEITFEEIHRNGAIAYAIFNYVRYTGDDAYLADYGIDVLVEISRFWESRVNYNKRKDAYMILGVTGPNEYDNNVNNNWYTNRIASWTLEYTIEILKLIKDKFSPKYSSIINKLRIKEEELVIWQDIINKMYYPADKDLGIFLQQDGYLDKEDLLVSDIPAEELPINQHWSWDKILRSPFLKQADVLQGLYFLDHLYDMETKKKNFDFYEPRTIHESSLSPCIHSIMAAEIGYKEKAYEMYLRTARLDLDNVNNDTCDGLHITSMSGTWLSIVHGFGGMRVDDGMLSFKPFIPDLWGKYSFKLTFRGRVLRVSVDKEVVEVFLEDGDELKIKLFDEIHILNKISALVYKL